MLFSRRTPHTYRLQTGVVWTLDEEEISARTPRAAIDHVRSVATHFPADLDVIQGNQIYRLRLHEDGDVEQIHAEGDHDDPAEHEHMTDLDDEVEAVSTEEAYGDPDEASQESHEDPHEEIARWTSEPVAEDSAQVTGEVTAPATFDPDVPIDEDREYVRAQRRKRTILLVGGSAVLLVLSAATGATYLLGQQDGRAESADETTGEGAATDAEQRDWTLPDDVEPMIFTDQSLLVQEGDRVRALDTQTGEETDSWEIDGSNASRVMKTDHGAAIDDTAGTVLLFTEEEATTVEGSLNARGNTPVVITEDDGYLHPNDLSEEQDTPNGSVVLSGVPSGAVMASAPATVRFPDGDDIDLEEPEEMDETSLDSWIAADESRVVTLWTDDDDSDSSLVTHDPDTGEILTEETVENIDFTVTNGLVVSEEHYLDEDNELQQMCENFRTVSGYVLCDTEDGWEAPHGDVTAAQLPQAISAQELITSDGEYQTTDTTDDDQ